MAFTEDAGGNGMVMPVAPMYGNGNGGGFGFGGDWAWILLLLVLFGGGWGNNGWGNGFGGNDIYPWMNQSNQINNGFRDQMLGSQIGGIQNAITAGFGDVQNSMCAGFAGVNAGIANGFAQAEIASNARQIADLERSFAAQTANTAGMSGIQAQLAQCCCENKSGIADLRYTVATEACADRQSVNEALRDVLAANTASTQRILDQLCQDKIDAKNDMIAQLRSQVNELSRQASQNAQTAQLLANNEAQTAALEQYLAPVPRPCYVVQNPNCCGNYTGCGCAA